MYLAFRCKNVRHIFPFVADNVVTYWNIKNCCRQTESWNGLKLFRIFFSVCILFHVLFFFLLLLYFLNAGPLKFPEVLMYWIFRHPQQVWSWIIHDGPWLRCAEYIEKLSMHTKVAFTDPSFFTRIKWITGSLESLHLGSGCFLHFSKVQ